jgi:hypothetical protein
LGAPEAAGVPAVGVGESGVDAPGPGSKFGCRFNGAAPAGTGVPGVTMTDPGCGQPGATIGAPIEPVAGDGTVVLPQKGSIACCPECRHPQNAIAARIATTSRIIRRTPFRLETT